MNSKPTSPKQLGEKLYIERCPKGKHSYSRHRLQSVATVPIRKGVHRVTMRCRLCGGERETIEDYTVLSGVFSLPAGAAVGR